MIPFRLTFEPGVPLHEQLVYAAKKAIVSGQMQAGDSFPSVRALSTAFSINPNTAHKAISQLVSEGLLVVHPGLGTVVSQRRLSTASERGQLLKRNLEVLVVEARKLGLELDDLTEALAEHWSRLEGTEKASGRPG